MTFEAKRSQNYILEKKMFLRYL